ncbi:carboxymuconolactone decarboxylase family protein [Streptomyces parvus]|uniref:carboxymuconolactone decarboxylase family protein n=1 Tax=Streptomyces parvus TaxID=66428 RepID=UPI00370FF95D
MDSTSFGAMRLEDFWTVLHGQLSGLSTRTHQPTGGTVSNAQEVDQARYEHGLEAMYELGDKQEVDEFLGELSDVCPALGDHIVSSIFGTLRQRPGLSTADRELITLVVLATLGGCEREIRLHTLAAIGVGLPPQRLTEALLQVSAYAGVPRSVNAVLAVRETFKEVGLLPVPRVSSGPKSH